MKHKRPDSNRFALPAFGALSLAAVLLTGAAQAATVVQTVNFTVNGSLQLDFGKFDTSLGTLTSVTLDWYTQSKVNSYSIKNNSTNNLGGPASVTYRDTTFTQTFDAYVPASDDSGDAVTHNKSNATDDPSPNLTLTAGQTYNLPAQLFFAPVSDSVDITSLDASFNSFKGTGSVPLFLTSIFQNSTSATVQGAGGGELALATSMVGTTTGSLGVTYTYEVAAVPEPSDFLLCAAPVLLGGAGLVRRKRQSRTDLA